jgi:hypothetical protein
VWNVLFRNKPGKEAGWGCGDLQNRRTDDLRYTDANYFLMSRDHPPLIIYDEDKAAYYAALEAYDKSEEITPMHDFLRQQTERTWEKSLGRKVC